MGGSGVFTKGNENVHCQSSKKDVIRTAGNEDSGKRALGRSDRKTLWCKGLFWILSRGSLQNIPRGGGVGVRVRVENELPWTTWEAAKGKVMSLS